MKTMPRKYIILIIAIVFALSGSALYAQVRSTDVILSISPEFPTLNQSVTATLTSYVTDLSKAFISWSVNNQKSSAGIGKSSFSFNMGSTGSETEITATVETLDGQNLTKTITVMPTNIDMLWQAEDAYAPPFYKGKTLAPSEGTFRVVAIPNANGGGGYVSPNSYTFLWKKDDNAEPGKSGWGKNYFIYKNSYLDKANVISVNVSDIAGNYNTEASITLTPASPKIVFYKKDPLFGIKMEKSLGNDFIVGKDGATIVAIPYFITPKNINSSDLDFKWYISDSQVATPSPKNEISVKADSNSSGTTSLRLFLENTKTLFVSTEKQINVNF